MDRSQTNKAIAMLCGWDWGANSAWSPTGSRWDRSRNPMSDEPNGASILPNYCGDLNLMREAVMAQTPEFRKAMRFWLYEFCGQMGAHDADAPTRARAFLEVARQMNLTATETAGTQSRAQSPAGTTVADPEAVQQSDAKK